MTGAPSIAAFCTISTETRLVSSSTPSATATPLARQRAGQLVERIVPADILAHARRARAAVPEAAACTARVSLIEHLCAAAAPPSRRMISAGVEVAPPTDVRQRPHRLVEALDAAEPAAGRAGEATPARRRSRVRALRRKPHAQLDARARASTTSSSSISRRSCDDAFGQAEAEGEVLEVGRRRHHHRMGRAVIAEARPRVSSGIARTPCAHRVAAERGARDARTGGGSCGSLRRRHGRDAAATARRARRTPPATRVGPFDGVTCTAVTLYSGQLVAQSEIVGGDDVGLRRRGGGRSCRPRPARRGR